MSADVSRTPSAARVPSLCFSRANSSPAPSPGPSPELARLLGAALSAVEGGPLGSWRGLVAALADRAFTELDGANVGVDHLVSKAGCMCMSQSGE